MLPRPGTQGPGQEEAPKEPGLAWGSDQEEPWSSGEEEPGEAGTPAQDCPQPQALGPAPERTPPQPPRPPAPAAQQAPEAAVSLSPQVAWEGDPSRMTLLSPWDPKYQVKATPPLMLGTSCGPGASFSTRTLCHPSWPMYDAWGRASTPGGEQTSRDTGLPASGCEDVFLLDPQLPCGQRIPLYLSEPPQQAMGSLKLLLPPPIMSTSVCPSSSPGCSSAWLSEAEVIALTALLQMSQGEPGPSSVAPSPTSASCINPVSDHLGPSEGQSFSETTDPSPTQDSDTHCP